MPNIVSILYHSEMYSNKMFNVCLIIFFLLIVFILKRLSILLFFNPMTFDNITVSSLRIFIS